MSKLSGIEIFLEVLARSGVTHLFGNPGTTELPLNQALARDPRFQYIFGLHEVPVMAMADGYAMANRKVGVVNVHIACGLGNSLGMLYNAYQEGTPLLLTAGQQDRRLQLGEPVLQGDLVRIARPWTKWAYEVQRVEDMALAVRRAVQIAQTPPTGPVFLSLPLDVQLEQHPSANLADDPAALAAAHELDGGTRPSRTSLARAAELLRGAQRPVILAGSRVTESGAIDSLERIADWLGAPVYAEGTPSHGRLPFRCEHPLYRGVLPYWSDEIHKVLAEYDVALAVGLNLPRLYIYREPSNCWPRDLKLIQLDHVPQEIAKNIPPDVSLLGNPRAGLDELHELLAAMPTDQTAATARTERWAKQRAVERESLLADCARRENERPLAPLALMHALARALPPNAAVIEEAITTHHNVLERLGVLRDPTAFFAQRGWALGWGMGCALGVKLAWPDRPVLGLIGDGAAMYGIQALWSAAHHRIPVTFVIANNSQYKILRVCGDVLKMDELRSPTCPGLDLTNPSIDFVGLARSLGVHAERLESPDQIVDRVRTRLAATEPTLLEVPLASS